MHKIFKIHIIQQAVLLMHSVHMGGGFSPIGEAIVANWWSVVTNDCWLVSLEMEFSKWPIETTFQPRTLPKSKLEICTLRMSNFLNSDFSHAAKRFACGVHPNTRLAWAHGDWRVDPTCNFVEPFCGWDFLPSPCSTKLFCNLDLKTDNHIYKMGLSHSLRSVPNTFAVMPT